MTENTRIINICTAKGRIVSTDDLIDRLEALEKQLRLTHQVQVDQLQQGEDRLSVRGTFTWMDLNSPGFSSLDPVERPVTVSPTWNEIFCAVAPALRAEVSTAALTRGLTDFFSQLAREELAREKQSIGSGAHFSCDGVEQCWIQLDVLGLMAKSDEKKSVTDKNTYWQLTPRGEAVMANVCVLKKREAGS